MKFGGSSLKDDLSIKRAAEKITKKYKNGYQVAVVVSARGDNDGRTNITCQ